MTTSYKKTALWLTIAAILLVTIPTITWIIDWQWSSNLIYSKVDLFFYLLTETGSAPIFGAITSLVFATILSLLCRKHYHWLLIFGAVFILQLSTQIIKTGLKHIYKEPRPYMSYMVDLGVNSTEFYDVKRSVRKAIIQEKLDQLTVKNIPHWLQHHWETETGYSFPSGHSIFAACWLFIFIGFLSQKPTTINRLALSFVALWAILMLISRLRLGMHFPIDLFISTIFAYLINLAFFYGLSKNKRDSIGSLQLIKDGY